MNSHSALRSLETPSLAPVDDGVPNFQRLSLLLRRRLGLLLLFGIAGLGLALGFVAFLTPLYDAHALVLMRRAAPIVSDPTDAPDMIAEPRLWNELEVLRSKELAADVLGRLGPDDLPGIWRDPRSAEDFLRDTVAVSRIDESHIFVIAAVSSDPAAAARVANAYADAYVARRAAAITAAAAERRAALEARVETLRTELSARQREVLGASRSTGELDVTMLRRDELAALIDSDRAAYAEALSLLRDLERDTDPSELRATILSAAVPPELPRGPKPFMIATLGAFLGLGLGGAIALARENLDATPRTGDAVRLMLGQPFLGYLPRIRRVRRRDGRPTHPAWRAAVDRPRGRYAETLRFLRARAEERGYLSGAITIGFCSARQGEGKSLAAANFAALLGAEGRRVLLIDADTRGPGLGATFASEDAPGLADLTPPGDPETSPGRSVAGEFAFLPARGPTDAPPLHLMAAGFAEVLAAQRAHFDFIIVDLPSLETAAYTRGILPLLDGWTLIMRWGVTPAHAPRTVLREEPGLARNLLGVALSDLKSRALRRYTPHADAARDV
jgi:Mrp family chromosome partitioning ATPase/capsular polysaccharide biosynthesis protein